jgi:hypothetical protein
MTTEIAQDDPKFLPTKMGVTEYKIRKLREEYDPANLPATVVKGSDEYQQVHQKVMAITKIRTGIEAVRKELKADALAWGKKVDCEAKRLTCLIEEIEEPWKDVKRAADEEQARLEEEARQAEQKRVEAIEVKVKGLQMAAEGLLNANADAIEARLDKVRRIVITEEDYAEYYDAAVHHHQIAVEALAAALASRVEQETIRKQLAEQQRILAEQQAMINAQQQHQKQLAEQQQKAALEAQERQRQVEHQAADISEEDDKPAAVTSPEPVVATDPFGSWWLARGRHITPMMDEQWGLESFRERLALAAWNASYDEGRDDE